MGESPGRATTEFCPVFTVTDTETSNRNIIFQEENHPRLSHQPQQPQASSLLSVSPTEWGDAVTTLGPETVQEWKG